MFCNMLCCSRVRFGGGLWFCRSGGGDCWKSKEMPPPCPRTPLGGDGWFGGAGWGLLTLTCPSICRIRWNPCWSSLAWGAGEAAAGAGIGFGAACSSGFANMLMNLDAFAGFAFTLIDSSWPSSAPFTLPQFPNRIPYVGSAGPGVWTGAVNMGPAAMPVAVAGAALDSFGAPLSPETTKSVSLHLSVSARGQTVPVNI